MDWGPAYQRGGLREGHGEVFRSCYNGLVRIKTDSKGFTKNGRRIGRPRLNRSGLPCTGCGGVRTSERSLCRTCSAAKRKAHRQKDPERTRRYLREWAKRNPDKVKAASRRNYAKHSERFKQTAKAWGKRNPKKRSAIMAFQNAKRRSRKKANGGRGFTRAHWLELVERFGGKCAYCRIRKISSIDHFEPLARGGPDDYTNIAPACASCNSRKGIHEPREWVRTHYSSKRLAAVLAAMLT